MFLLSILVAHWLTAGHDDITRVCVDVTVGQAAPETTCEEIQ